jgi:hypothetical protein
MKTASRFITVVATFLAYTFALAAPGKEGKG